MAVEICLTIADDGSMTVSTETAAQEQAEGPEGQEDQGTPVKSLDEAVQMIKQLAQSAAMPSEQQTDAEPDQAPAEEEDAMMSGYRGGVTGR